MATSDHVKNLMAISGLWQIFVGLYGIYDRLKTKIKRETGESDRITPDCNDQDDL